MESLIRFLTSFFEVLRGHNEVRETRGDQQRSKLNLPGFLLGLITLMVTATILTIVPFLVAPFAQRLLQPSRTLTLLSKIAEACFLLLVIVLLLGAVAVVLAAIIAFFSRSGDRGHNRTITIQPHNGNQGYIDAGPGSGRIGPSTSGSIFPVGSQAWGRSQRRRRRLVRFVRTFALLVLLFIGFAIWYLITNDGFIPPFFTAPDMPTP